MGEAQLGGQGGDAVLGGPDPLAAQLDAGAVVEHAVVGAAADPVTGLDDPHRPSAPGELPGGDEPRQTGSDDDDIDLLSDHVERRYWRQRTGVS